MDSSERTTLRNCPDCVTAGDRCQRCWHAQTRTFFLRDGETLENMDLGHEIVLERHDDKPFLRNGNYYFLWEGDVEGGWDGDTGVTHLRVMEFTHKRMDLPEDPDSVHEFWEFELVDDRMPKADLERLVQAVGQAELADLAERQNQLLPRSNVGTPADYRPVLRQWFQNCAEGRTVWTGRWPELPQQASQTDVLGYGLMLVFCSCDGHLCGGKHRRHDELVAEVVTMLGADRCTLDSVQVEDGVASYVWFIEPGEAPTAAYVGFGEKYGPFTAWMTTHSDGDVHETSGLVVDEVPATPALGLTEMPG